MFRNLTIDCQDLDRQAALWAAASGFERLVGLGARRLETRQEYGGFAAMQDPEGNEFCVAQERPR